MRPIEIVRAQRALTDELTLDAWVTSDHHWGHDNIVRFQDRPADHDAIMRAAWLNTVREDDVVLHLGDLSYKVSADMAAQWLRGLPGRKFILLGNHDKWSHGQYQRFGFTVLGRGDRGIYWFRPDNGSVVCFSHEPETEMGGWSINVHGHIHRNPHHPAVDRLEDRRNVCVEVTNYAPVRLRDVLAGVELSDQDWNARYLDRLP